jgi:hypothetical protein
MSSDDAYMAFLNKANADSSDGQAQTTQESSDVLRTKTVDSSLSIPKPLKNIDAYYVSDTDEPFDPVVLKWDAAKDDTWPSIGTFTSLPRMAIPSYLRLNPHAHAHSHSHSQMRHLSQIHYHKQAN